MSVPEVECKRTYQRRQQTLYNMSAVQATGRIYEPGEKKNVDKWYCGPGDDSTASGMKGQMREGALHYGKWHSMEGMEPFHS